MSDIFILDACALIALLRDEDGSDIVAAAYQKANYESAMLIINKINLFEVYYGFYRDKGKAFAENLLQAIKQSVVVIHELNDDVFSEAGRLKATYKMSLADSIALAEALVSGGAILTADHHEFDIVEQKEKIKFEWIR